MADRILAGLIVVPFLLGAAAAPVEESRVLFSFQDGEIVESSGLALVDGLVITTNDSGDTGRVFAVDPATGKTVGTTSWATDPIDVEALAPARGSWVWVGDIGDNSESRDSIQVAAMPVGRGAVDADATLFELTYPDGRAHDAETLMSDPTTGDVYLATKSPLGGQLFAVPTVDRAELRPLGEVLPLATDGAFFPDGRHVVVRNYEIAAIYAFPSLRPVGSFRLPSQAQGEGIAVDGPGRLLLSSEGAHSEVLRVDLPAGLRAAMADASPAPTGTPTSTASSAPTTESREDSELPETTEVQRSAWPWLLTGLLGIAFIVVLTRSLRRR